MNIRIAVAVLVSTLTPLTACGSSAVDAGSSERGGSAEAGVGADARSSADGADGSGSNGPLSIVSLTSTVAAITSNVNLAPGAADSVTFIAIVTDTAGLDAIAGGTLMDDGGATYGAFGAGSQKGTYSLTETWGQLNQVRALDFSPPGTARKFVAKFFDNSGTSVTASIPLQLHCGTAHDQSACTGVCVDLQVDPANCGSCGHACAATQGCRGATCREASFTACAEDSGSSTCEEVCKAQGKECAAACGGMAGLSGGSVDLCINSANYSVSTCDVVLSSIFATKCCCA